MSPLLAIVAAALAVVAVVLAVPVPRSLARAAWPSRAPARALLLWQAIALAGGLSMIGALVAAGLALAPLHALAGGIVLGAALALAGYLLGHLGVTVVGITRSRRRHRALVELLTSPHPGRARTVVLDESGAVAYCLPHGIRSLTVLSRGLIERLDAGELAAVVAHERAHLEQRHDIVLVAFRAWQSALPWFPIAARAAEEVAVLVELLADDSARRIAGDAVLARAIAAVATTAPPGVTVLPTGAARGRAGDRIRRLVG